MIDFRLSLDALGQTRFAYSPLAEVAASLRVLTCDQVGPVLQPWQRAVNARLDGVDLEILSAAVPPGPYSAHFLFLSSSDPRTGIDDQLDRLLQLSDVQLHDDLAEVWEGRPVSAAAAELMSGGRHVRRRLVDAVSAYWRVAIEPYWSQMRAVLDDDVSYRARQVLGGGLYDLLTDLHPEVSIEGGVLHVDKPHLPDLSYDNAKLTLLPSIFVWPKLIIGHGDAGQFEVFYAARGVGRVWEETSDLESADSLGALLGRTRAAILGRLDVPLSTSQLARELNQSPGTVSEHLSVLRRSGLLTSWRSGRSVLYRRTPLASSIVAVNQSAARSRSIA